MGAEKCTQVSTEREKKEAGAPPISREAMQPKNKPQKAPEKLPPKSERLQKFEERLKGTAWKVAKVDATPTYRLATEIEKKAYANLSDVAAEKKGLKRTYNEKGGLIATEIAETTDHKVTLELGGKEFNAKLPIEVRQYMKSLGFTGPHITFSNVLIDADGAADIVNMNLHVSDRDHGVSAVKDLEESCKKAIRFENVMLTPKALQNMEKVAIEWYSQQCAMHLDDTTVKKVYEKADKGYQAGVEKDINALTDKWVGMGKKAFIAEKRYPEDKSDQSTVNKIKDKNGNGIAWNNIMKSNFYGNGLHDSHDGMDYGMKVYLDLATGNIGKVVLTKFQQNTAGLTPGQESVQAAESERLTSIFRGKSISEESLASMKGSLPGVIKDTPEEERKKQSKNEEIARQAKDVKVRQEDEQYNEQKGKRDIILKNWESVLVAGLEDSSVVVGELEPGTDKYGFTWSFVEKNSSYTLKAEIDLKTGKFKKMSLSKKEGSPMGLNNLNEKALSDASTRLSGIFEGKKLSQETVEDLEKGRIILNNSSYFSHVKSSILGSL